jgi:hypothetical protein
MEPEKELKETDTEIRPEHVTEEVVPDQEQPTGEDMEARLD